MVRYLLEETYELADAVASDAAENVCEELGDVLFHVLFIAQMHAEAGAFTLADVCRGISDKMTRRHPHVFGSTTVADSDEVVRNWRRIKQGEKNNHQRRSVLDSLPASLPSLMRAFAVSERALAPVRQEDVRARWPSWEKRMACARLQRHAGRGLRGIRRCAVYLVNVGRLPGFILRLPWRVLRKFKNGSADGEVAGYAAGSGNRPGEGRIAFGNQPSQRERIPSCHHRLQRRQSASVARAVKLHVTADAGHPGGERIIFPASARRAPPWTV
jgi:hypothetical protein